MIFGLVGAVLLMGTMRVQSIIVYYETNQGEKYAVTMDYSVFGTCVRCSPRDNSEKIVEKAMFFGEGKEATVLSAAEGLVEIAKEDGSFQIQASGFLGDSEGVTEDMVNLLQEKGYTAQKVQE